jgi:hypothetical protein
MGFFMHPPSQYSGAWKTEFDKTQPCPHIMTARKKTASLEMLLCGEGAARSLLMLSCELDDYAARRTLNNDEKFTDGDPV